MKAWRSCLVFVFVAVCFCAGERAQAEQVPPAFLKVKFTDCLTGNPLVGRPITAELRHEDGTAVCTGVNGTTGPDGSFQFLCPNLPQFTCDTWMITLQVAPQDLRSYQFHRVSHQEGQPCYRAGWISEWVDDTIIGNCGTSYDESTGWWTAHVSVAKFQDHD